MKMQLGLLVVLLPDQLENSEQTMACSDLVFHLKYDLICIDLTFHSSTTWLVLTYFFIQVNLNAWGLSWKNQHPQFLASPFRICGTPFKFSKGYATPSLTTPPNRKIGYLAGQFQGISQGEPCSLAPRPYSWVEMVLRLLCMHDCVFPVLVQGED